MKLVLTVSACFSMFLWKDGNLELLALHFSDVTPHFVIDYFKALFLSDCMLFHYIDVP